MSFKAVIFDMGGVLTPENPEIQHHITAYLKSLNNSDEMQSWAKTYHLSEIGEISFEDYEPKLMEAVAKMIGNPDPDIFRFSTYAKHNGTREIMNKTMLAANLKIRENGYKTAVLTNNAFVDKNKTYSLLPIDTNCFDVIVESCRVGMAKPDERIFQFALDKLGCQADEAIFLDDKIQFVSAAEEIGITAIHVTNIEKAAGQLLKMLDLA